MFIAMNRFTVAAENAEPFEALWLGRDSHLKSMDGFVAFHMLKGPAAEDATRVCASHTVWPSEEAFRTWTRSHAFRAAHEDAGSTAKLHVGSPQFEGSSVIQRLGSH